MRKKSPIRNGIAGSYAAMKAVSASSVRTAAARNVVDDTRANFQPPSLSHRTPRRPIHHPLFRPATQPILSRPPLQIAWMRKKTIQLLQMRSGSGGASATMVTASEPSDRTAAARPAANLPQGAQVEGHAQIFNLRGSLSGSGGNSHRISSPYKQKCALWCEEYQQRRRCCRAYFSTHR